MIKPDNWIREMATTEEMITPFVATQQRDGVISYGLSSYGYDIRIANDIRLLNPSLATMLDPKNVRDSSFVQKTGDHFYIPPNSFVLARSVEYFKIPRGVMGIVTGKSTYARCGLIVNVTPLEPEWCGHITIELSNSTPVPVKVYTNEGIAQVLFFEGAGLCDQSYKDKSGKYQGQTGVVLPLL